MSKIIGEMVVKLSWDEERLCKDWMNPDNLQLLLYSKESTLRDLLKVEVVCVGESLGSLSGGEKDEFGCLEATADQEITRLKNKLAAFHSVVLDAQVEALERQLAEHRDRHRERNGTLERGKQYGHGESSECPCGCDGHTFTGPYDPVLKAHLAV